MNRRSFLKLGVAPAIILTPGLLMPVRKLWTPAEWFRVVYSSDEPTRYYRSRDGVLWLPCNAAIVGLPFKFNGRVDLNISCERR